MTKVHVTDRNGNEQELDAPNGDPLMEALRDQGDQVAGTCGGMCACGTCHVYVSPDWAERLPPKSEDEEMMLEAIGELIEVTEHSRLSCQIEIDDSLAGLTLEIAPEF